MRPAGNERASLLVFGYLMLSLISGLALVVVAPPEHTDFPSFVASARALQDGLPPYTLHPDLLPGWLCGYNLNAPVALFAFYPLAQVDPLLGLRLCQALSLVLYLSFVTLVARQTLPNHSQLLWSISFAGVWSTIVGGQIYVVLLGLTLFAWWRLKRHDTWGAALAFGLLIAVKPNYLVLPALLLAGRQWRLGLQVSLASLGFGILPVLVFGPNIYAQWLTATGQIDWAYGYWANASLIGALTRLGLSQGGLVVSAVLLLGLALWAWLRRPPLTALVPVALLGAVLAAPVGWVGYMVVLLPWMFDRHWTRLTVLAAAVTSLPLLIVGMLPTLTGIASLGSVYCVGLLLLLWSFLLQPIITTSDLPTTGTGAVNRDPRVTAPESTTTTTDTTPLTPAGTVQVIDVSDQALAVAAAPPNVTVPAP